MKKLVTALASLTVAMLPNIACSDINNRESIIPENNTLTINKSDKVNLFTARTFSTINAEYAYKVILRLAQEIQNNEQLLNKLRNPQTSSSGNLDFFNQSDVN